MVGCRAPGPVETVPDDLVLDALWCDLLRGDVDGAAARVDAVEHEGFRHRARLDVASSRDGRSAVVVATLEEGDWLAARYLASGQWARKQLREAREAGAGGPVLRLEEARRSGDLDRRLALARAAAERSPGGPEGLAVEVEALLSRGRLAEAEARLEGAPDTARLRLARRNLQARTGRLDGAVRGLLDDLATDRAVPGSVELLQQLVVLLPLGELEGRALAALDAEAARATGALQQRAVAVCRVTLLRRAGRLEEAASVLAAAALTAEDERGPSETRSRARWTARAAGAPTPGPGRDRLRLLHEWDLAARASYAAVEEEVTDLDTFLAELDEAATHLGPAATVTLAEVPVLDYGLFGTMLDTRALREALPGAFAVGGKGLGMPPELAAYDLVGVDEVALPDPPGGTYDECRVAGIRVHGFAASRGARFAGAGLDQFVFLDLDQVALEARSPGPRSAEPLSLPAHGVQQRRAVSEPLDVGARLRARARADAGDAWSERVLETLALHEQQHIVDVRAFLERSAFGMFLDVAGAGLLPGAVRAEVERRAQLQAMRRATDPRIALAQCVDYLPVEGARLASEHARGYGALVADLLAVLDRGDWPGAEPLDTWGIDRSRVLLHQLDRLPPEVVRSLAEAVPLD